MSNFNPFHSIGLCEAVAIIAPHAGLLYSGSIAAQAYRLLAGHDIDIAVLVGPSHYVGFEGVAIYDRGTDQGRYYIVLEFVSGGDLHDWVRANGPMPVAEAIATIRAVAEGLRFAAARGLIHTIR